MKIKCIKETENRKTKDFELYYGDLVYGKVYEVISVEKDWYRIIDKSGDDHLYPPELFEIVETNY